jgi:hypothetical protein
MTVKKSHARRITKTLGERLEEARRAAPRNVTVAIAPNMKVAQAPRSKTSVDPNLKVTSNIEEK